MTKTRIKWTKELANIESIKYNTRTEFQKKSNNAYSAALRNKWLDEICGHMVLLRNFDPISNSPYRTKPSRNR